MNISNAGKRVIRIKKMKNICTYTKKRKKKKKDTSKTEKFKGSWWKFRLGYAKIKEKGPDVGVAELERAYRHIYMYRRRHD